MIQFIDINNGNVFSGVKPYIHWFDNGQSVCINYYKEIIFLSDKSSLNVKIEENPYFKLMDFLNYHNNVPYSEEQLNSCSYYNIQSFLTDSLSLNGIDYNEKYLYRFFVYAFSQDTGEYTVDIDIDDETIEVGADFYPENELLTNDLENLGIEIPMQIQKAIYESNVHEEAMDNILINRKWKELLLEYWNIIACKGNYKSLINSMKFFEYGDLLKIMEFWKVHYNKDIFISNDLEQILNDRFREQLSVLSKTTYIGLYLALNKIKKENDIVKTEWDYDQSYFSQDNPVLENVSTIWSAEDLALKMTLVGNFFSTYFMPLHLDLIHSTIEHIVFTNTIKILSGANMARRDYVDLSGWFQTSVKKDQNYYIKPQDVYVTSRTILGIKDFTLNDADYPYIGDKNDYIKKYSKGVKFLGVDTEYDTSFLDDAPSENTIKDIVFSAQNMISLFGALVPIDVLITTNVRPNDALKSAYIHWVKDSSEIYSYSDNGIWINTVPYTVQETTKYKFDFKFNLLFTDPGTYHFYITFTSTNSFIYSQEFLVNILDDAENPIHIYKVERVDPKEYENLEVIVDNNNVTFQGTEIEYELNEFLFSQTNNYDNKKLAWSGTEYICADINNMQKSTGLNHVVMFTTAHNASNAKIGGKSANGISVEELKTEYPDYLWFERVVSTAIDDGGELINQMPVITGIRKYYTVESEYTTLYKQIFTRNNYSATVTIDQLRSLLYVSVIYSGGDYSNYSKQYKLSDYIEFEVFGHKETVRIYPDYNFYKLESENGKCKGHKDDKIKCEGDFYQLVDEDRFIPMFHKLVRIDENNCEIMPSELIVAIPELKRTYTDYTDIVWEFMNSSTMESIKSYKALRTDDNFGNNHITYLKDYIKINFFEPLIGRFVPRVLTPGYYNINLNYKYAGEQHKESRDAAFKIRKIK